MSLEKLLPFLTSATASTGRLYNRRKYLKPKLLKAVEDILVRSTFSHGQVSQARNVRLRLCNSHYSLHWEETTPTKSLLIVA